MVKRGNVYMIELEYKGTDSSVEQGVHPVLVISNDYNNCFSKTVNIIPLTSTMNDNPSHVVITGNGLKHRSVALVEQITTIDKNLLKKDNLVTKITDQNIMKRIVNAIIKQTS